MSTPVKIHFILFLINLFYSLNYVLVKNITPKLIEPFGLQLYRVIGAFLLFQMVWLFQSNKEKVPAKDLFNIAGCSLLGVACNGLFYLKGISVTYPINASLIMILVPVLVLLFSVLFFRESIQLSQFFGAIIGLLGASIVISKLKPIDFGKDTVVGDIFIFLNTISFSLYLIFARDVLKKYSPITMAKWLFTFGLFYVIPFGYKQLTQAHWNQFETGDWAILAYILIFPTFLAYLLYNVALKKTTSTIASSYIFLQPILTAGIALSLGVDRLDTYKLVGGALIFLGVYFVSIYKPKAY